MNKSAPLAPADVPASGWVLHEGRWRIAKIGFIKTGSGPDDYETCLRLYLPKTGSELRQARKLAGVTL